MSPNVFMRIVLGGYLFLEGRDVALRRRDPEPTHRRSCAEGGSRLTLGAAGSSATAAAAAAAVTSICCLTQERRMFTRRGWPFVSVIGVGTGLKGVRKGNEDSF